jgi:hypothetical protein
MTGKLIGRKARQLNTGTRRKLLGTVAGPLAALFFYGFGIKAFQPLQPELHLLFACALAWSVVGLYFVNRGMWSAVMPGDAGLSTGLEFCRQEIARRRLILRRVLLWSFGPVLLAIATFILALATIAGGNRGILPNGLPFLGLVFVWILGYCVIRLLEQRGLDRELAELNEIDQENSR